MKLESKTGLIAYSDERIYTFLTNFENFKQLIPADKIRNWQADENSCRFSIDYVGDTGVKVVEKVPFKLIKLSNLDSDKYNFIFWVQLKPKSENETYIKCTMEADLNPMLQMIAKKPLQDFLDKLIDQLGKYTF
jgi:carbon monoxide dehydrogenase subunit G